MTVHTLPANFAALNAQARVYPASLLPQYGTALSLFSAGFWGWNDVIHLERAEMRITCVDQDANRMFEMAQLYPGTAAFHVEDVWEFATETEHQWDVVTVDPWVPMMKRVLDDLPLWCGLARHLVTVGCLLAKDPPQIPKGWRASLFPRNDRVGWLVLQR